MNITFQKGTKCRRLLACCLAALLAYGLASCSDELGGRILSGPGTLVFNVGGIAQVGAEILTRAQMEPQTLTQDLGDGTSIVYTLSLDPITATRASSSMAENTQYLVIVYEEDGQYVTQAVFKAGETGRITGLDYKKYKVVAISYNSTTEAPPTVGSSAVTVTVDPSKDLLHWTGEVNLTSGSAPEVEIAFKHRFTQLSVQVDASLTGNNIIELPATATLTPAHRGVLTLRSNGAMETTDGASPQEFSLPRSPGAQKATSDNSRFVFTGPDTDANNPVRLKFNGNVVIKAPSGDKTLTNPVATFSTVLLGGYSYTLNMRMEASKGDYYPYAGKTGYGYECTIPLGANGYNYTDKNGDSQHVDELTFLTYNLGADPELSPKEQMAYPFSDDKNIRVYGGLWQWGRKDAEHSLRDPYSASDTEHFQNAQYPSYDPINDHKFAWGTTTSWWCASDDEESNMWGNGGGYTKQTDFSYNSAKPNTTANDWNPCPTGYR
ncbi:MAG: fimbrillin family protein, partial [Dysgonamonadaceae bacterium]|nr:fimbrillin family protein [Dysgonamonadaceae bacterium]